MTRRDWILALATGLGTGLLPGCRHIPLYPEAVTTPPASVAPAVPGPLLHPSVNDQPPPPVEEPPGVDPASAVSPTPPPPEPAPPAPPPPAAAKPPAAPAEILLPTPSLPEVRAKPAPKAEHPLLTALRCVLENRSPEVRDWLQAYDPANQEVLLTLLPLAARLGEGSLERASPDELAGILEQLDRLATPLRPRATLTIGKMCFCRDISHFGSYEPLAEDHVFRHGEPVTVYLELRNFSWEEQGSYYVTRLAGRVYITNFKQQEVWQQSCPPQPDRSRTPRHDYFINVQFPVPDRLPPGPYTLWIEVKDVPTNRVARRSLDFRVTPNGFAGGF